MTVVAVVFDAKQPCIFHIGIRQHIAGCRAVHKPPFYQKPNKPALRDIQLFGGSPEIGAVLQVAEQVIESGFAIQLCSFLTQ